MAECICGNPECTTPRGACHCGCGQPTTIAAKTRNTRYETAVRGLPLLYVRAHSGRSRPLAEKVWEKVDKSGLGGCWLWTGALNNHGYGQMTVDRRRALAHRMVYELVRGAIPAGLTLDHLCRNPACVNPDHLEPVSLATNILRGESPNARNARKTECIRGHLLVGGNVYIHPQRGTRHCRNCEQMRKRGEI